MSKKWYWLHFQNNWSEWGCITAPRNHEPGGREVYYDVEYSLDNKLTYHPIASNLTGTWVDWDGDGIAFNTDCWIKVTGYSIDQTLIGTYEMNDPFTFGYVGVEEETADDMRVLIYPNPSADGTLFIQFDGEPTDVTAIGIQGLDGRTLVRKAVDKNVTNLRIPVDVSEIPCGMYLVQVTFAQHDRLVRKLLIAE